MLCAVPECLPHRLTASSYYFLNLKSINKGKWEIHLQQEEGKYQISGIRSMICRRQVDSINLWETPGISERDEMSTASHRLMIIWRTFRLTWSCHWSACSKMCGLDGRAATMQHRAYLLLSKVSVESGLTVSVILHLRGSCQVTFRVSQLYFQSYQ